MIVVLKSCYWPLAKGLC